jgi:hypothetical protein
MIWGWRKTSTRGRRVIKTKRPNLRDRGMEVRTPMILKGHATKVSATSSVFAFSIIVSKLYGSSSANISLKMLAMFIPFSFFDIRHPIFEYHLLQHNLRPGLQ